MADIRRLSWHVIKLRDIPEGLLVLSGLSCVWKSCWTGSEVQEEPHQDIRLTLQRLPFYCIPHPAVDDVISDPNLDDLAVGTHSAKILAKTEASQKRKASTSSATSSHVAKRTSLTWLNHLGTMVEVLLLPPLKVLKPEGIMVDDVAAPPVGVRRLRPSSGLASSFRDVFEDAIHTNFFPFMRVLIMLHILKVMLLVIASLLARSGMLPIGLLLGFWPRKSLRILLFSHHEYVQSTDSRLKGFQEKFAGLSGLESQVSRLQRQVTGFNDKLSFYDAAFAKSKSKGKERKKNIKSLTEILAQLNAEVTRLSTALNQANVLETKKDEEILRSKATSLEFESFFWGQFQGLVRKFLASDEFSKVKVNSFLWLPVRESTVTPAFESLELSANVVPASFVVASERNKEWVNAMVDGPDSDMTDGSKRVSSGPTDVVVALSVGEKGDGSLLSFATNEEATANLLGFRLSFSFSLFLCVVVHPADHESCHPSYAKWLPPGTFSIAGQASPVCNVYTFVSSTLALVYAPNTLFSAAHELQENILSSYYYWYKVNAASEVTTASTKTA
uniref:Uncharacterized protein n=1 Tax=Tanacetum cinerariifolium TaxID=118510 RepID=A0A699JA43_TANCI|nr:hypothetical protein [Tanacetum cinerariifolium]